MKNIFLVSLFMPFMLIACDGCWGVMKSQSRINEDLAREQDDATWRMYFIGRSEGFLTSGYLYEIKHKGVYSDGEMWLLDQIDHAQEDLGKDK